MVNLKKLIVTDYPVPTFVALEFVFSFFALGPTPSFIPLVLFLSVLRLHGQRIVRRSISTQIFEVFLVIASVIAASSLSNESSASSALSSPTSSFLILALFSSATSLVAFLAIYLDLRLSHRFQTPWIQITCFPLIWATIWSVVSNVSPVGRLLTWSAVSGVQPYSWTLQYTGPVGLDWIVAAWSSVCSYAVGTWLMGPSEDDLDNEQSILHDIANANGERKSYATSSKPTNVLALTTMLLLTASPSFFASDLPRPPTSEESTPFSVGCVLPWSLKPRALTLEDYIQESARMNSARVILWPESAVSFESTDARDAAFKEIRRRVVGPVIGVTFEEYVPDDIARPGRSGIKRNGLALISNKTTEPMIQYYKRNLVPIAESFSMISSIDPPGIHKLELSPPKGYTKPQWSTQPNFTRPVSITSSICLDFASPSAFLALESRPALILAPARTWDTSVGVAMWEQANIRAQEIGSMVLWCDGGDHGLSGVAGQGVSGIMQVGRGSWIRTVGLPYPFDTERTVYARAGHIGVLAFLLVVSGSWVGGAVSLMATSTTVVGISGTSAALRSIQTVRRMIAGRGEQPAAAIIEEVEEQDERSPLIA